MTWGVYFLQSVPVMGAIMLNPAMDKCLLVKSWGSNGAWGFPRGKISTGEADIDCARREVHLLPPSATSNSRSKQIYRCNTPSVRCTSHDDAATPCHKVHQDEAVAVQPS
jgi:NUDIX domain